MDEGSYWVYVLELGNGRRYVGQTNNLERRLAEHRSGRSRFTRKYEVVRVLYREECGSRSEALKREKFLKSGKGREWLKVRLAEQSA
ncbi:MAG: GIY-YIG nuclease family protein [Calditrichaeota bacterium]|nr:GIY-YIG nuclease family protein [Calditrichota bacterium]